MSARTPRPRALAAATLLTGALLLGGLSPAAAAGRPGDPTLATTPGVYVVTLAAPPAAEYAGTRPRAGQRFDRTRPAVASYARRLVARQDAVLASIGDPAVLYHYTVALNGFAATLDSAQVRRLRSTSGVVLVERSTKQHVDQAGQARQLAQAAPAVGSSSRDLLGLSGRGGVWAQHGGPAKAGRGVVVGVVDTGIWPDNPSFNGLPQSTPGTAPRLPGFHGECAAAEDWSTQDCNDKVVSARWFVKGFGEENTATAEYLSPRDGTGHGSHVASTAAGDHGVRVKVDGQRFGTTSGMAPAARLAVYKACWTAPDPANDGCSTADTIAAVDSAVGDGVDVLNFSISGSNNPEDSLARAFLGAASAGVFVATSAGNAAHRGTVQHVEPWVTTVGASTHHRFQGAVRLGDGRSLVGAMVSDLRVAKTRVVLGTQVAAPDARPAAARHCQSGALDATRAQGAIVVCERGAGARVDKSSAVAAAGGAGMVLVNTSRQSTDADVHAVPTVHLDVAETRVLKAYLARTGDRATASFDPDGHTVAQVPSPAGFTSRGPAVGTDVLKPDLTAPGVSVLGAVAPPSDSGRSWDLVSGTSTSAPHVAGLAAFVAALQPSWSPARIKSAMMTSAYDLHGRHDPLTEGAGHVSPADFLDPGLVFDTPASAWRRVAAGTLDLRDVNTPSIAIDDLVGHTTVTRRITNVSQRAESYAVRVKGLRDVDVQAFPATVRLRPGESRTIRLRITARPSATVDRDVTGWLVWRGDRHRVRIPVAVRPTVVAAPKQVDGRGDAGSVVVRGRSGNGRTVKLHATGLVPAKTSAVALSAGDFDVRDPAPDQDTDAREVVVPAGTDVARFEVESNAPGDDVDLYVYRDGTLVDSSTGRGNGADVTVPDPTPGTYTVYVNAHTVESSSADGVLSTWLVPHTGGTEVELSTDAVGSAPGKKFRYSASWDGLDPAKRWLGVVSYGDSERQTLVEVN